MPVSNTLARAYRFLPKRGPTWAVSVHRRPEISSRPHGPCGAFHFKRSFGPDSATFYRFGTANREPCGNAGTFCGTRSRQPRFLASLVRPPQRTRCRPTTPSPVPKHLAVSTFHSPGKTSIPFRKHCRKSVWRQMETGPVTMTGPVPYQHTVGETFSPTRPSRSGSRRYRRSTGPLHPWPSGRPSRSAPRVESRCNREV